MNDPVIADGLALAVDLADSGDAEAAEIILRLIEKAKPRLLNFSTGEQN